jgi:hypothetical protein
VLLQKDPDLFARLYEAMEPKLAGTSLAIAYYG